MFSFKKIIEFFCPKPIPSTEYAIARLTRYAVEEQPTPQPESAIALYMRELDKARLATEYYIIFDDIYFQQLVVRTHRQKNTRPRVGSDSLR